MCVRGWRLSAAFLSNNSLTAAGSGKVPTTELAVYTFLLSERDIIWPVLSV